MGYLIIPTCLIMLKVMLLHNTSLGIRTTAFYVHQLMTQTGGGKVQIPQTLDLISDSIITGSPEQLTFITKKKLNIRGIITNAISGDTGNNIGRHEIGYSPNVYYVYKQVYDPNSGKPIEGLYEDMNRDGAIDEKDRYYYKKPASDIFYGI